MRHGGAFFAGMLVMLPAVVAASCTPQERADAVEPAIRISCILLRAFGMDGRLAEVCATAEELAPYVGDILASRAESPASSTSSALVAFALPAPARRVPARRCVQWMPVAEARARAREAGAEGGAP